MRVFNRWILVCFIAFSTFQAGAQPIQKLTPEIKTLLNEYYFAVEAVDQEKALLALGKLIAADSGYAPYYSARASIYLYRNDPDTAQIIRDLSTAIRLDSTNVTYYKQRATLNWKAATAESKKLALSDYKFILTQDTFYIEAYQHQYDYYLPLKPGKAKRIQRSGIKTMKENVNAKPYTPDAWYYLGRMYDINAASPRKHHFDEEAYAAYCKAIALDSINSDYHFYRGIKNCTYKQDYLGCINDMEHVLFFKNEVQAYYYKALAYQQLKQPEMAVAAIEIGLLYYPENELLLKQKEQLYQIIHNE